VTLGPAGWFSGATDRTLKMAIPFVHIQARGSYRDLGRAVGEGARDAIHASVAFFRDNFSDMTHGRLSFADAEQLALAYAAQARRWTPQHLEELEGVAQGAGLPLSQLLVPNCGEEFTANDEGEGARRSPAPGGPRGDDYCTAVAVAAGGRHVIGHNMDWYVVDASNSVLFDLTVPDGTRIMGIAGAPYLLMLGMNSHGVGNVSNSVHSNDNRVGVPNAFVRRASLESVSLETARDRGLLDARARGTNHFLADTQGRLWDVETSATASAFMDHSSARSMAHTNHYVAAEMAPFEAVTYEESPIRLTTAEAILTEGIARGDDPVDLVARALRCHDPAPHQAICGHPDEREPLAEQGMTVGSMICDLDERRLYVCAGPPCENPYQLFEM
jgi:isopenicillin-N N-acyltransferase-like protein